MNGRPRPSKNVSEMVICDVRKEIVATAKRYINLILQYPKQSKENIPCDIPNGQVIAFISSIDKSNSFATRCEFKSSWLL